MISNNIDIEAEKEAKIQSMLLLNNEILEGLKEEFQEYIQKIDEELDRRKKKEKENK